MAVGLNYFINCQGFPVIGMTTVLIGTVCNIILDPVFIFGLNMGIAGAAVATVISQFLSCSFALAFLAFSFCSFMQAAKPSSSTWKDLSSRISFVRSSGKP